MDVVRTAVSVIGASDPETPHMRRDENLDKAKRLFAKLPAIIAYTQRRLRGEDVVPPRDDLGYSANFLHMTFGEVPDLVVVSAFDVSMILYAEHSFNASTFTARVVTSTLADIYSAVVGGDRRAQGSAARRCERSGDARLRRDRQRRQGGRLAHDGARREAQDHGLRPPGLQERRFAGARP